MDTHDSTTPLKRCTSCGEAKPLDQFSRDKKRSDGLQCQCKACNAAYRNANKDRINERGRKYYAENRETIVERARTWHLNNREYANEQSRIRYGDDRDRVLRRVKAYRIHHKDKIKSYRTANKDAIRARETKYRERYRDKRLAYSRSSQAKHSRLATKHRRRARTQELPSVFTGADWQTAVDYFGGCCAVCGRPPGLWHTLAADHWIPLASPDCPGTVPWNIVPLCHGVDGCNNSKGSALPSDWLTGRFGKRKGQLILRRITSFLNSRVEGEAV